MSINEIDTSQTAEILNYSEVSEIGKIQIRDVYKKAFREKPYEEEFSDQEIDGILGEISEKGGQIFTASEGDQIVSLGAGFKDQESDIYWIYELATDPAKQRKGYGEQVLSRLVDAATNQGSIAIELRTNENNTKAISLYKKFGFEIESRSEVVPQKRVDGSIRLDKRSYLFMPLIDGVKPETDKIQRVTVMYPNGNTTALVFDNGLIRSNSDINDGIMTRWTELGQSNDIEQGGFITIPNDPRAIARLEMFGGEFCGNATRSAISIITDNQPYSGLIEVSGAQNLLAFEVFDDGEIEVEMPLPIEGNLITEVNEGILVQLDGIAQLVVFTENGNVVETPREMLERLKFEDKYQLKDQPAFGISYYNRITKQSQFCVWVNSIDTTFDETACGSGTCASAIAEASSSGRSSQIEIIQPSGESITAFVELQNGEVSKAKIKGKVSKLYDGSMRI